MARVCLFQGFGCGGLEDSRPLGGFYRAFKGLYELRMVRRVSQGLGGLGLGVEGLGFGVEGLGFKVLRHLRALNVRT